jgi:hypothetical protein
MGDPNLSDSLLVALSSYRPRPGRRPIEDFITEALAWLLRTQDGLGRAFLQEVVELPLGEDTSATEIEWSTQESFSSSRPDMVAWVGDTAVAFEHKVHEAATRDQLQRHQEGLTDLEGYGQGRLVLITSATWHFAEPDDEQNPSMQMPFERTTWPRVHDWLSGFAERVEDDSMIREFQALLQSRGLGPRSAIPEPSLRAYRAVQEAEEQIWVLFRTLKEEPGRWEFLFDQLPHLDPEAREMKGREGKVPKEGRIGIRFPPWTPGVFVGVLVDGDDHEIDMSDRPLGPDLVVVLDVSENGTATMSRQEFLSSSLYASLVARLEREAGTSSWEFIDTHGRSEKGNPWHPLILRRPLAEVLRGRDTFDEQREAVHSTLKAGIELLLDDGRVKEAGSPR